MSKKPKFFKMQTDIKSSWSRGSGAYDLEKVECHAAFLRYKGNAKVFYFIAMHCLSDDAKQEAMKLEKTTKAAHKALTDTLLPTGASGRGVISRVAAAAKKEEVNALAKRRREEKISVNIALDETGADEKNAPKKKHFREIKEANKKRKMAAFPDDDDLFSEEEEEISISNIATLKKPTSYDDIKREVELCQLKIKLAELQKQLGQEI
jgi:hypothetical protein